MKVEDLNWKKDNIDVFWGEIAPSRHLIQLYENEEVFLTTLESFVTCGFRANDSVVILATDDHLLRLNGRLLAQGFNITKLKEQQRYLPINADEALGHFMVKDWPDRTRFRRYVSRIISSAKGVGYKVRAFGELVSVLWANGHSGATVQLEHLWEHFIHEEKLSLFCAYPKSGFTEDPNLSLQSICASHSLVISGAKTPTTEIYYRNVNSA